MEYVLFGSITFNVLLIVIIAFYAKEAEENLWLKYNYLDNISEKINLLINKNK